jgi:hypothetical protein
MGAIKSNFNTGNFTHNIPKDRSVEVGARLPAPIRADNNDKLYSFTLIVLRFYMQHTLGLG